MRQNTPPSSPFIERGEMIPDDDPNMNEDDGDDDDMIYIGYADEVLEALENAGDDDDTIDEEFVPIRDDATFTFTAHEKPVFCGAFCPTQNLIVTGGEDDKAYIWSEQAQQTLTTHKDTVIAASFSASGAYVATGDMAGFIQVCDVNDNMKLVWEYEMGDMSWMRWHTVANVLLAGAETGETYVWLIPSGDCKVLQGNGHKSETAQLTPDGKSLVVGYADGSVKWWDIKSSSVVQSYEPDTPLGHTEAITCIITLPDNKRFISGSTDGKLMIASTVGPLGNFFPNAGPIEALAISPDTDGRLFVCGTLTGRVSVWDVARQAVRVECHPNDGLVGITNIIWLAEHMFACSTLDGSVQLFDSRDGQNVKTLLGHAAEVYDIKYRQHDNILLTTSEDGTSKIFRL